MSKFCALSNLLFYYKLMIGPKPTFLECIVNFLQSDWSTLSKWPQLQQSHCNLLASLFVLLVYQVFLSGCIQCLHQPLPTSPSSSQSGHNVQTSFCAVYGGTSAFFLSVIAVIMPFFSLQGDQGLTYYYNCNHLLILR